MGMFDYVKFNGEEYQTKSFTDDLDTYYIENGRIFKGVGRWVRTQEGDKWQELFKRDMRYHGVVYFYGDGGTFTATFKDGFLENVEEEAEEDQE